MPPRLLPYHLNGPRNILTGSHVTMEGWNVGGNKGGLMDVFEQQFTRDQVQRFTRILCCFAPRSAATIIILQS